MPEGVHAVHVAGVRPALRAVLDTAIAGSPLLTAADGPAGADVVLADACAPAWAGVAGVPDEVAVVLLSVPGSLLDGAEPATFGGRIAEREAEVTGRSGDWCVLRCAAFGQELAMGARFVNAGAVYAAWQPGGAPWVDAADVVAVLGEVVRSGEHWGRVHELTGPEVVPVTPACATFAEVYGSPVIFVQIDQDMQRVTMIRSDYDGDYAAERASYMFGVTAEPARRVSPVVAELLGRPARGLGDYLVDTARQLARRV
ncbi:hypothetical protein [Amycolatopsis suaedae]|uniref:Uncharacterized protein n=1 Tax=Amycolatopsis suaedae TaxID=2510978 RepID=A0A4Q7JFP6_9PSEU|nr:hypothetical protein [Amycolatopsis suaedae]RZQ66062.1 hypothetical protein EWH70_03105 [Amycolatopsis suaedae]